MKKALFVYYIKTLVFVLYNKLIFFANFDMIENISLPKVSVLGTVKMKREHEIEMIKKRIKMIGLDCDGTLLNDKKELTPYSKEVLCKAIDQGIVVLAATGRPLSGIPKEVKELPGIRYALTANGARIVDMKGNKVIYEATMSIETAIRILEVFEKYDTYKEVFIGETGFTDAEDLKHVEEYGLIPSMVQYLRESRVPVADVVEKLRDKKKPVDKVQALFKNIEEKEKAFLEIRKIKGTEPTGALHNNIEVNAAGVNKGLGLLKLGELLGISREEIMACGDGMNDLEMLKEAGFGVAVANAVQPVKDVADYVTESNEEDGVANAIVKFALV